jgi:hypothetical protein
MKASVCRLNGGARKRFLKTPRGRRTGPSSTTPQKVDWFAYFFFADFFAAAFLAGAFFFAAIKLTTFHAVRDLPVAPTWQNTPDCSGKV